MGIPPVVQMMRAGVHMTISLDTMAASDNSDMFAALRKTMCIDTRPSDFPGLQTGEP
jgi:cytosine/adenosine deaminase-related metal-dependent hydrolase